MYDLLFKLASRRNALAHQHLSRVLLGDEHEHDFFRVQQHFEPELPHSRFARTSGARSIASIAFAHCASSFCEHHFFFNDARWYVHP